MNVWSKLKNKYIRYKYEQFLNYLTTVDPKKLQLLSEKKALICFKQAAKLSPAYKKMMQKAGVNPREINTIDQFKEKVPIIDKKSWFSEHELSDLAIGGSLDGMNMFWSSSGHTGTFAYGVGSTPSFFELATGLDFLLHQKFRILNRSTLIINGISMGTAIPTKCTSTVNVGTRHDVAVAMVQKLRSNFEQIIIIGETPFIKRVVENLAKKNKRGHMPVIHVVTGGQYVPETFRRYISQLLNFEPNKFEQGSVIINMGISEVSLSIFSENFDTVTLRQKLNNERTIGLLAANRFAPALMQHFPSSFFIETINNKNGVGELVVTANQPNRQIPIIRYRTGDYARMISSKELACCFKKHNFLQSQPAYNLPVTAIYGREGHRNSYDSYTMSDIQELIYQIPEIARRITGNFKIERKEQQAHLLLQLEVDSVCDQHLTEKFGKMLTAELGTSMLCSFLPYEKFPYHMVMDLERKFRFENV